MSGTFSFGDNLVLESVPIADINRGDVLVYCRNNGACGEEWIVHRAVKKTADGIIAQGDKNLRPDITLVTENNFAGRVTHIIRGDKAIKVRGALVGYGCTLFLHNFFITGQWLDNHLRSLGRAPYTWLRESHLVARIWRPKIRKMQVMTKKGPIVKYIIGRQTVAEYSHYNKRLVCRKPYDLVLWPVLKRENCI